MLEYSDSACQVQERIFHCMVPIRSPVQGAIHTPCGFGSLHRVDSILIHYSTKNYVVLGIFFMFSSCPKLNILLFSMKDTACFVSDSIFFDQDPPR